MRSAFFESWSALKKSWKLKRETEKKLICSYVK